MSSPSPVSSHSGAMEMAAGNDKVSAEKPAPFPVDSGNGPWKYNPLQYCTLPVKTANPYFTTAIACMGGLLFGFSSTNLTPFIGKASFTDYFGEFTPIHQSGMSAAFPGGSLLGSTISVFIADAIGRRGMFQLAALFFVIGSAIQTASNNRVSLAFGRIIAAVGVGFCTSNVPLYLSEIVPPKLRGGFVSCFQFSVNLGILSMFYIGFGCHFMSGQSGWRLAWGIQMIPGFIMFAGSLILHESPRWLAAKGKWDECVDVLTKINKCDAENPAILKEIELFQADFETKSGTFFDLFNKRNYKQTFCAFICMLTQQFCGVNAIVYFSTSITGQVGYEGNMSSIMGSICNIILLVCVIPPVLFLDRWSRRHNMIFGSAMMVICMAVVAGVEATRGHAVGPAGINGDTSIRWTVDDKPSAKAALAFTYIFLAFFSFSWGPVAWVYCGEIFNPEVRAIGNAFGSIINWLFNFALTLFVETSFETITWKTYVIFAVFAFLSIPCVFLIFPETRGFELEQISVLFDKGVAAYKTDPWFIAFEKMRNKTVDLPEPEPPLKSVLQDSVEHEENVN